MNTVLLAVILIPIVEIYLFIKIGSQIGAFTTIFLVFFTAVVGVYYARYEGINTLRSGMTQIIKNPLSPENAAKLEEQVKDVSKAALVHHTAMQQDELKIIIEERDLLYKENEIYHDSLERALEENKNLRTLIQGWKKFRG